MNGSFSLSKKSFAPRRVSNRILRQVAKFIKSQDMCLTFYTLRAKKFRIEELFCVKFDQKRGSDREAAVLLNGSFFVFHEMHDLYDIK